MEQIEREFLEEQRRKLEGDTRPQPDKPPDDGYVLKFFFYFQHKLVIYLYKSLTSLFNQKTKLKLDLKCLFFYIHSKLDSKAEERSPIKNHLKSPEKSKKADVEEGEITSDEEPLEVRRKKDKKQKKKEDKRKRVVSVSDEHSYTESAIGLNGVKDVSINFDPIFIVKCTIS